MRVKLDDLSPEKRVTVQDFKSEITAVFNDLYEEKWDQHKWDQAIRKYKTTHDSGLLMKTIGSKERTVDEFWAAREKEFRKGPPVFVRPGWISPLVGQRVSLDWLDDLQDGKSFEWIKGQDEWEDEWRNKKLVVFEFWTSWCGPCIRAFRQFSQLAETYDASVLMVGINSEEIFSNEPIDIASVYSFVEKRGDMNFPIAIDVDRIAVKELFDIAGRRAVPTVFIISIKDGLVHFVGDPADVDGEVDKALAAN